MKKRILAFLLAVVMTVGLVPMGALATDSITVYVTISNKGVLAADKNGDPMGYRDVTVTDQDDDGKLTIYDAYTTAHSQYCDSDFKLNGTGLVGQLWGDHSGNFLTFVNNAGISGTSSLKEQEIEDGAHLVGAILSDTSNWSDYISFFDSLTKTVSVGNEVTLTLEGRAGMSWTGEGGPDAALSGLSVGTWDNGRFSAIDGKTTDANGQVTLSFDTAGTYYVTASGTVSGFAPIIAPICVVTVTEEKTDTAYVADDAAALNIVYTHGQNLSLPAKGQSGKTTITWTSDKPVVISGTGAVTKPAEDTVVTLTATITCNEKSDTKEFEITVPGRLNGAKAMLDATILRPVEFTNATDGGYKYSSAAKDTNILDVARAVLDDADITVALADSFAADAVIASDGTITYPADEAKTVTLPLKLTYNEQNTEVSVSAVIPKHAYTKTEEIEVMKAALAEYMNNPKVLNGNTSLEDVKTTLLLPGGKSTGLYIKWTSSNTKVIANQTSYSKIVSSHGHPTSGYYEVPVMRPGGADATVTLTAELTYRSTSVDLPAGPLPGTADRKVSFTVKVPALTEGERKAILDGAADDIKLFDRDGAAADITNIKDNLYFPAYDGFTTKWTTDLAGIAMPTSGYGKATVTRPEKGAEDQTGAITLTLTAGDIVETKTFDATVLAWTEEDLTAAKNKLNQVAAALTFDAIDKDDTNASADAVTNTLWLYRSAGFAEGEQAESNPVNFEVYNKTADPKTWPIIIDWTIDPSDGPIAFNANQPNKGAIITTPAQDTKVTLKATINYRAPIAGVNAVEKTITVIVPSEATLAYQSLMDNIAARFAASGVAEDANAPWLAADMAAYQKLFPNTANKLSGEQKQAMADLAIENLAAVAAPGEAAKYILSLVSMGYDPAQLTTAKLDHLNAVAKLNALTFGEGNAITEAAKKPYTLPYVIIAYQQFGDTYKTQVDQLVAAAVETKSDWMNTEWGPDGMTPMVLALAPYYSTNENIKTALEEALTAIVTTQKVNGSLYDNAASTGLGVVAYASIGTDPKTVVNSGKHLLDGLMAYGAESKDGFQEPYGGTFNTEQGFRGLIAYHGFKANSTYRIYDFSGQTLVPAAATEAQAENCSVQIIPVPAEASVVVKKGDTEQTMFKAGYYDLAADEYNYTVACDGYVTKTETFTITAEDVTAGTKTIRVSLTEVPAPPEEETISVSISVGNPNGGFFQQATSCTVLAGTTAKDLLLSLDGLTIVSSNNSEYGFYVESINGVGEFDQGSESGWMFKVNGVFPRTSADNVVLKNGDAVEWVYTRSLGGDVGDNTISPDDAAAAERVEALIDAIGTVTKESGSAIQAARTAYDKLTDAQKLLVDNYSKLTAAETTYDNLLAAQVEALISAIGTVTKHSGPAIDAARTAYDVLTPAQKTLVGNYKKLTAAEKTYDEIMATQVETLINAIGTVAKDSGPAIQAARAAYNKLTDTQKLLVDNYSTLALAEKVFAALPETDHPFTDAIGHWAEDAITFVYEEGLMTGTKADKFSPNAALSRAMLVTILYRMEGEPVVTTGNTFSDVKDGTWYTDAVLWATGKGIVNGVGKDRFAPENDITREQMAAMLLRYADYKGYDTNTQIDLSGYTDVDQIGTWALDALRWANAQGLITGRTTNLLVPQGDTTRAETATILMRYLETIP